MKNNNIAVLEGIKIRFIVRWAKNGKKYTWENPTQNKMNQLIKKYGIDQIGTLDGVIWLQT